MRHSNYERTLAVHNNLPEKHIWRFFALEDPGLKNLVAPNFVEGQSIELAEEERKLLQVLRLSKGQAVEITNGRGSVAEAQIEKIDKKQVVVTVGKVRHDEYPLYPIHLYVGRARQTALEESIESAAQLGCDQFCIVDTAKTSSTPGKANRQNLRFDRLEKIARESVRISKSAWLPKITTSVFSTDEMLSQIGLLATPLFVCDEAPLHLGDRSQHHRHLSQALSSLSVSGSLKPNQPIALLIGPESGFTEDEKRKMLEHTNSQTKDPVIFVSLGNNILTVPNAVRAATALAGAFTANICVR